MVRWKVRKYVWYYQQIMGNWQLIWVDYTLGLRAWGERTRSVWGSAPREGGAERRGGDWTHGKDISLLSVAVLTLPDMAASEINDFIYPKQATCSLHGAPNAAIRPRAREKNRPARPGMAIRENCRSCAAHRAQVIFRPCANSERHLRLMPINLSRDGLKTGLIVTKSVQRLRARRDFHVTLISSVKWWLPLYGIAWWAKIGGIVMGGS